MSAQGKRRGCLRAEAVASGLVVAANFPPQAGGLAEHAQRTVAHWTALGERVVVLAPDGPDAAAFDAEFVCPVVRFRLPASDPGRRPRRLVAMAHKTVRAARRLRADYLACWHWEAKAALAVGFTSCMLQIPYVLFAHGSEFVGPTRWAPLRRRASRRGRAAPPDAQRLLERAAASPVPGSVVFLRPLDGDAKWACFERCTAFAMASTGEGFGIVFTEAAAFGRPSIAPRNDPDSGAVLDGETGLLVDPDDVGALAEAAVRLLSDPVRARRLGDNARRRVEAAFAWPVRAAESLAAVQEACVRRHRERV